MKLRRTPYLKIDNFRRKLVKIGRTRPAATPFFASGRVRTRPIWRVRLPKRCKGCAPQPPNRPVVVQRPTPCNFSTVCSGLGGLCGLCGAKAHTAGQLSPIFVDLGNLCTWGPCGSCFCHAGAFFSTAVRETGRPTDASGCDPIFCVRTRPDASRRFFFSRGRFDNKL